MSTLASLNHSSPSVILGFDYTWTMLNVPGYLAWLVSGSRNRAMHFTGWNELCLQSRKNTLIYLIHSLLAVVSIYILHRPPSKSSCASDSATPATVSQSRYQVVTLTWWLGKIKVSAITTFSGRPAANTTTSAMSSPVSGSQFLSCQLVHRQYWRTYA